MINAGVTRIFCLFLLVAIWSSFHPKCSAQKAHLIAERTIGGGQITRDAMEGEVMDRVESQLLGALELLQSYQAAAPIGARFPEKRRNKFEFIRFGRKRR